MRIFFNITLLLLALESSPAHAVLVRDTVWTVQADGAALLLDEPKALLTPDHYRLEAWVGADAGAVGTIELVLYDANTLAETSSAGVEFTLSPTSSAVSGAAREFKKIPRGPNAYRRAGFRYIAMDIPLEREGDGVRYNIRVTVRGGDARIAYLRLVDAESILPNGDFSKADLTVAVEAPTPRGWRRMVESSNAGKEATGEFTLVKEDGRGAMVVRKSAGTFVLSAQPCPIPAGTRSVIARASIDNATNDMPRIAVRQYGRNGMIAEDAGDFAADGGVSTGSIAAQPEADRLMFVIAMPEAAGEYRVHDAALMPVRALDATPIMYVDQVGYDSRDALRFLIATTQFPAHGGAFTLTDAQGRERQGVLEAVGRAAGQNDSDWGAYYFEGVAPGLAEGTYTLTAKLGNAQATVSGVVVAAQRHLRDTAELAYRFYSVQRCGVEVAGWHGLCHMDDAKLPDGTHVDVTGGYHNAGDMHKHTGDNTPISVYAMAALYERHKNFIDAIDADANGRADLLDEAVWGADWLLKIVDHKTGRMWQNVTNDIDYFGIPEHDTDGIVGTADDRLIGTADAYDRGAFSMAAWAVLGRLLPNSPYGNAAKSLWDAYAQDIHESYDPRHLIAAIELHESTGEARYVTAAEELARRLLSLQGEAGWFAVSPGGGVALRIVDEGIPAAALATFALTWPDAELTPRIKEALRRYAAWSMALSDNPFGVIRHYAEGESEPYYFKSRDDWYGGSNSAYCSVAWAGYLSARVFADDAAYSAGLREHAAQQLHWILSLNPLSLCMFEGKGNSSRMKFHHLYAEIPGHPRGAVPGAIPNGIIREPSNRDAPWFDFREETGTQPGAESAEPWLPHNALYLLAVAESSR